jgi:hypothetical protein
MTKKQELVARLNELLVAAGENPVSEKWAKRAQTWTIQEYVNQYEKEAKGE